MNIVAYVDGIYNHVAEGKFCSSLTCNTTSTSQMTGSYAIYDFFDILSKNIGILEHDKIKNRVIPLTIRRIFAFENILENIDLEHEFKISCNVAECMAVYTLLSDLEVVIYTTRY